MWYEIFLTFYYIFSFTQSIPAVIKLLMTHKSHDYNLGYKILQTLALICWTIYVFNTAQQPFQKIAAIVDMGLLTLEDILILIYYNK